MTEKEPQISRHVWDEGTSRCYSVWEQQTYTKRGQKKRTQEATEKIQISIMLISNNKTIPFNYYLLARSLWMKVRNERGLHVFPVPLVCSMRNHSKNKCGVEWNLINMRNYITRT